MTFYTILMDNKKTLNNIDQIYYVYLFDIFLQGTSCITEGYPRTVVTST